MPLTEVLVSSKYYNGNGRGIQLYVRITGQKINERDLIQL